LGVELVHDPDRVETRERLPFNSLAMMQRVGAKAETNERARKQKESRMRYLKIKQEEARKELEKQEDQRTKLEKYLSKSAVHAANGFKGLQDVQKEGYLNRQREWRQKELGESNNRKMEEIVKNLKVMSDEEYQQKIKKDRLNHRIDKLAEKEELFKRSYDACSDVMAYLLEMANVCYVKLGDGIYDKKKKETKQLDEHFFKELEQKLREFASLEEQEDNVRLC
jgi:hypothetical protein